MSIGSQFDELVEDFAKDPKKETDGAWMTFGRHEFLVARSHRNNVTFLKLMEKEMRPYQWAIDRGNFGAIKDAANDVMKVVYAATVLKGIRKLDGTALDYTPEDGVELFKKLPDLWDAVFKFSNTDQNYAPDQIEADSKN
jgi:hypothetical protein